MTEYRCEVCGKLVEPLPYICNYCGGIFCVEHRLPEKHNCVRLRELREFKPEETQPLTPLLAEFERAEKNRRKGFLSKLKRRLFRRE
ncbi:MAG: hypothetical protein DRO46_01865 [Candidatus Hecatellales archaeon]|nr:MAG: hypothetical protein DRO46_01865 [Candidatus Hecatellales archaeon]